mmetsp:Transcript_38854/g.125601  ORF Transcript_38854/g.125601 Transcript_38854/m.125601 type:complete len:113 (+) Transcript_38854:487-825(+)
MWPLADADMPLSVMLGVMPNTGLWIFPAGCCGAECGGDAAGGDAAGGEDGCGEEGAFLLPIGVGEMVVWRGDLVHAGAGYAEPEHFRVHAYVDPPARIYQRPKGKTNLCPGV